MPCALTCRLKSIWVGSMLFFSGSLTQTWRRLHFRHVLSTSTKSMIQEYGSILPHQVIGIVWESSSRNGGTCGCVNTDSLSGPKVDLEGWFWICLSNKWRYTSSTRVALLLIKCNFGSLPQYQLSLTRGSFEQKLAFTKAFKRLSSPSILQSFLTSNVKWTAHKQNNKYFYKA